MVTLYAFTCGWVTMPLRSFIADEAKTPFRVPVPAYLIEHEKGLAVFDTGLGVPAAEALNAMKGVAAEFDALADVGARLKAAGFDPGAVKWIINSHLHSDHSGGNASLPNATVVIQAPELDAAKAGGEAYEGTFLYHINRRERIQELNRLELWLLNTFFYHLSRWVHLVTLYCLVS